MKQEIVNRAKQEGGSRVQLNALRNELQHLILQEVDRKGGFEKIAFLDGTALRIVYGLDRFSEDLDFSTSQVLFGDLEFEKLLNAVANAIQAYGLDCTLERLKTLNNVKSCFFSFTGLLSQVNRSFQKNQKLMVKFDVDTNPPKGAMETVSAVTATRL